MSSVANWWFHLSQEDQRFLFGMSLFIVGYFVGSFTMDAEHRSRDRK